MSTTIVWSVNDLERHTTDGIIYAVHYRIDASDGTYSAGAYGSIGLDAPAEDDSVVAYADLTEEIVIDWVKDSLGAEQVEQVEATLQTKIDEQRAPTTATGKPW